MKKILIKIGTNLLTTEEGKLDLNNLRNLTYQISKEKRDSLKGVKNVGTWRSSISSFLGRLRWHCHFIQKLEDQPSIEWKNMSSSYDNIRDNSKNIIVFCCKNVCVPLFFLL